MACITNGFSAPGRFCGNLDSRATNIDNIFSIMWGATLIGKSAAQLTGTNSSSFDAAHQGVAGARSIVAFAHLVPTLEKIVTGSIVFKNERSAEGKRVWKDWMDIALNVCLAVGRIFSPVLWLNHAKAINLGKHAQWMGAVVGSAFTAVVSIGVFTSARDLIYSCRETTSEEYTEEKKQYDVRKNFAFLLRSTADFLAMPWDCGWLGFGGSPVLALVGGGLCTLSAGLWIISDWLFYEPDTQPAPAHSHAD